jgi:DNA-binding MarR family transcriptional regulator
MSKGRSVTNDETVEESPTRAGTLTVLPPLSEGQQRCLKFILDYFIEHRYYPTQREVVEAMGIRSSTAESYLAPLRRKGYLQRKVKKQRRNMRLTPKARQKLGLEEAKVERQPAALKSQK